jgi:hypothetical protein
VQDRLDRAGRRVGTDEDLGVIGLEDVLTSVLLLLPDPEEPVDRRAAVGTADPTVHRPELEAGRLRRIPDRIEGGEQRRDVHAVQRETFSRGGTHVHTSLLLWCGGRPRWDTGSCSVAEPIACARSHPAAHGQPSSLPLPATSE